MRSPLEILKQYWGYPGFRPLQEDIIQSVLDGKDTLALLPTGGGKSICFQVPGMVLGGTTLVISPLIALMQDQVRNLVAHDIPATYINSSLSHREIDQRLQRAMDGKYKFLYLAPERLTSKIFLTRLPSMRVRLLAVDEAHCISQWGYDFRPQYLRIGALRERLPGVPVMALTATATGRVVEDIQEHLGMGDGPVFRKSFRRPNLAYRVVETEDIQGRILRYLKGKEGTGIIYTRTRKRSVLLARLLQQAGIRAQAYHGGMELRERALAQSDWMQSKVQVMVATNAFGMGIDKPDVRFVLHFNLPADLESYFQEAGRAGRDGEPAEAIAFRNEADLAELAHWVKEKYPSWQQLEAHYQVLCNHFGIPNTNAPDKVFPLDLAAIARVFQINPLRFYNSVRLLDREGQIVLNERPQDRAWVRILVRPRDVHLYKDRYPAQRWVLDLLLRQLGGELFSDRMLFRPEILARVGDLDEADLWQHLETMAKRGILAYQAPIAKPSVRFLRARHVLGKQEVGWDKYTFLAEQAERRFQSIRNYVATPARDCRARMLEKYFGEEGGTRCGRCDDCRAKSTPPRETKSHGNIPQLLEKGPMPYWDLVEAMTEGSERERRDLIRKLLDKGLIEMRPGQILHWKK